jgi:hypothetical protein
MNYKNWCKESTKILAEAEVYNKWADEAKNNLLTNIGPRICKLGKTGYMGCGFHYGMEQSFGKLIVSLALPWQPSANWCADVEDDRMHAMVIKSVYRILIKDVEKAEKSPKTVVKK